MSSFFTKNKPKGSGFKRKKDTLKNALNVPKRSKKDDDEEIESDDAFENSADENGDADDISEPSIHEEETAQDKRLRLAKKYLEEIEKEEKSRTEDIELHDHVSQRLKNEYLDSVGRLRRNVASNYKGYKEDTLKVLRHKLHNLPVTIVCLSSDNKYMFTGSKTSFVVKWDFSTFKSIGSFNVQEIANEDNTKNKRRSQIVDLALTTDFKFLAVLEGGNNIQIWCPNELKHLKTFKGHRNTVTSIVFRKDTHQLYSGSKDRSVKIWSLDEMSYVESLFGHQAAITGIDALTRERAITSGGVDCSVRIWKITEESQLIYNGHRGSIESVKLINEENFISSGDDGSLCLWSTLKKKPFSVQPTVHGVAKNGDANWITSIAALVNTDIIASGSSNGFIQIWQLGERGHKLIPLFRIPVIGFVNSLAFTNDGSHLVAAIGQEHKLGRWWRMKEARNSIVIIEFDRIKS